MTFNRECGCCPDMYVVSEFDVYNVLCRLKEGKASLNNCIDNTLLRTLADVLAAPICSVINSSIREGFILNSGRFQECLYYLRSFQLGILKLTLDL